MQRNNLFSNTPCQNNETVHLQSAHQAKQEVIKNHALALILDLTERKSLAEDNINTLQAFLFASKRNLYFLEISNIPREARINWIIITKNHIETFQNSLISFQRLLEETTKAREDAIAHYEALFRKGDYNQQLDQQTTLREKESEKKEDKPFVFFSTTSQDILSVENAKEDQNLILEEIEDFFRNEEADRNSPIRKN